MKLYIVRHGETDQNVRSEIQGQRHTKLNSRGLKQAKLIGDRLRVVNFDFIYSSDLRRAKETTRAIIKYQNCQVKYVKALREKNYGRLDGKLVKDYFDHIGKNKNGAARIIASREANRRLIFTFESSAF